MSTTISPNMSLPVPVVGVEPGPAYASDVNNCLTTIDSHDHSSTKGVQITPAGLNITANLPMNSNNLTLLRSVRFLAQPIPLAGVSPDIGCAYFSGVDFYVNDLNGNQIRLTQSGGITGSPGSITGLVAGATVVYSAGTYTFQSAANTAANLDAESIVLRNVAANSKGLTLNPPSGMANNYSLTLPLVSSSSTSFLQIDSSGVMTPGVLVTGGITASNIAGGTITTTQISSNSAIIGTQLSATAAIIGTQLATAAAILPAQNDTINTGYFLSSASSGAFSSTSGSATPVTNLDVTLSSSTTSRPTFISFTGTIGLGGAATATFTITAKTALNSTTIATFTLSHTVAGQNISVPAGCLNTIVTSYVHPWNEYILNVATTAGVTVTATNVVMTVVQV